MKHRKGSKIEIKNRTLGSDEIILNSIIYEISVAYVLEVSKRKDEYKEQLMKYWTKFSKI